MRDKEKAIAVVGGLGLTGLIAYFVAREVKAPPEGPAAGITIEILDAEGKPIKSHSSFALDEGATYTIRIGIQNQSVRAGEPWEATLVTDLSGSLDVGAINLFPGGVEWSELFAPLEVKYFTTPLVIPDFTGDMTGVLVVNVFGPPEAGYPHLADKIEDLTIISMEIIYGAIIVPPIEVT